MNAKQIDKMYDNTKLDDKQLDLVIGGVGLTPQQAVDMAPRLMMVKPVSKPIAHK